MHGGDNEGEGAETAGSHPIPIADIPSLDPAIDAASVSVSPAFYPGASNEITDTVLLSSDSVLFYIHSPTATRTQPNAFRRLLGIPLTDAGCRDRIIKIDETSSVVGVMLHALHDTPCAPVPPLESILTAVDKMRKYEISPAVQLTTESQLYRLVLSFAPVAPLDVYALAAFHQLNRMAVEASSHLVSYPLPDITDEMAARIGTFYLLTLFRWRLHRSSELKRIFLRPLFAWHTPTEDCSPEQQQIMNRVWAVVSAEIGYGDNTDITLASVQSFLEPHLEEIVCDLCKEVIQKHIRDIIVEWNGVPRTIPPAA